MQHDNSVFDFERLDVYQRALEFFRFTSQHACNLPRGERELRDQWKRAALSITLNIAEGTGKVTDADKSHFYSVARGSAMECAALLNAVIAAGFVDATETREAKIVLVRVVQMLSKMCR